MKQTKKTQLSQTTALIVTILNEAETITALLESIVAQTVQPNEVIIVDGGSTDGSVVVIKHWLENYAKTAQKPLNCLVMTKTGNRSIGRNTAVAQAQSRWLAITDAGCVLRSNWLEKLLLKQQKTNARVVAGFYEASARTGFEQAVASYMLVQPDDFDEQAFLPATRSMLIERSLFLELGGFDESLSDNEDYAFAQRIVQFGRHILSCEKEAVVVWQPVSTLRTFYWTIYRFARGDMQAKIIRPKVVLLYTRYILGIWLVFISPLLACSAVIGYCLWAIVKNYRATPAGWWYLPLLQIVSDIAVLAGSSHGQLRLLTQRFSW